MSDKETYNPLAGATNYEDELDVRVFSKRTWARYVAVSGASIDKIIEKVNEVTEFTNLLIGESGALIVDLVHAAFPELAKYVIDLADEIADITDKLYDAADRLENYTTVRHEECHEALNSFKSTDLSWISDRAKDTDAGV